MQHALVGGIDVGEGVREGFFDFAAVRKWAGALGEEDRFAGVAVEEVGEDSVTLAGVLNVFEATAVEFAVEG